MHQAKEAARCEGENGLEDLTSVMEEIDCREMNVEVATEAGSY